ncbi:hypothetical protein ACOME3_007621 [Neoechinorhynchus agilis]
MERKQGSPPTKSVGLLVAISLASVVVITVVLLFLFVLKPTGSRPYPRLPRIAVPLSYSITIDPHFENRTFKGHAVIKLAISNRAVNGFQLHSRNLLVHQVRLLDSQLGKLKSLKFQYGSNDVLLVQTPNKLKPGVYDIEFLYHGSISDDMDGIYISKYRNTKGDQEIILTTQFQALAARKAFPCFDEPSFKAEFEIQLLFPATMKAVSNMPPRMTELLDDGSRVKVSFARSPPMSTYLVAFSIGRFESQSQTDLNGIVHTVLTRPGKRKLVQFAMNVSLRALPYFSKYFNMPYPLPKLDLVAIPDFSFGAMENWGCSVFREQYLLVDSGFATRYDMQKITTIVGHELAHQWFGNLVTLEWWTDVWLNEGFATWIEYLCTDYLFPEFDIWSQFVGDCIRPAMITDRLLTTHPIEVQLYDHSSVMEVFGVVAYNKGASIIRMINEYMGEKKFRAGLGRYLKTYKYQNIKTEDLWNSLENSSGFDIKGIMSSWTEQAGFPVVFVDRVDKSNETLLIFRQEKMSSSNIAKRFSKDNSDYIWNIVITLANSSYPYNISHNFLMCKRRQILSTPGQMKWFKVNIGKTGFYVVHYSEKMLNAIINDNGFMSLSVTDRLDLQFDLYLLAVSGYQPLSVYLNFIKAYSWATLKDNKTEAAYIYLDDMIVWTDVASNLNDILTLTEYMNQDTFRETRKLIAEMFEPLALAFHSKQKVKEEEGIRDAALSRAGLAGVHWVMEEAFEQCRIWIAGNNTMNLEQAGTHLMTCVRYNRPQGITKSLMKDVL